MAAHPSVGTQATAGTRVAPAPLRSRQPGCPRSPRPAVLRQPPGHVDILVNNAGVYPYGPSAEAGQDDFNTVYDINAKAPFFLVAELAPQMAARGKGAIVNIATIVAHYGDPGYALYGSSKAALLLLTKAWAAEYGPSGVRVNAISPGPTRTEGTAGYGDALDQFAATTPHGRPGLPEEIAAAVTFLASDDASYIHGAQLPADGGRIAV